ncbi:MAG TPA: ATP-binding protein [Candidatus Eisenbacteria bacterium]|nr:ATP-binding protein [Candidatus Eisenbacteria bacterium]
MHPSLARIVQRHRDRLLDAVAGALRRPLGYARAGAEARATVDELERALTAAEPTAFLTHLAARARRWRRAGAGDATVARALLSLVLRAGRTARRKALPAHEVAGLIAEVGGLMEYVPTPMLFVDEALRVRAGNRAWCELANRQPDEVRGRALGELVAPGSEETLAHFLADGIPHGGEMQLARVRLAGRPDRELLSSRVPFSPGGRRMGWFLTFSPEPHEVIAEASLSELLERQKGQNEKFAALLTVSRAVVNTLELDAILSTIAKQVRQVIQTDECTVFLFDEREQVLVPAVCDARAYVAEMMAVRLRLGEGITGMVALTGRGEFVNDAEGDPRAVTVPGTPPEQTALLCVPLLSREKVVGVITLTRIGVRGFQQEDLELATLFAGQCSAAIANARLYENVKAAYDELRQTQAQLVQSAKLNALGEMAGGVAHDFNNILAAILGRTQLLLQSVGDPDVRRQLGVIEQAALDGAQTVRRVQEFTRVRQDERFETLDVNQVLVGVIELTRPAWEAGAKRRGVVVDVHLELEATQTIAGNASELREVFTNLVLNAVDAMPRGGHLWVRSENGAEAVRVIVRDSGVGMDAETSARIFDPFFTTKEVKGTGLGLSVAYGIVARHRGTIDVDSAHGQGTVFTLTFPVGAVARDEVPLDLGSPLPRLDVLVVDDEESVLHVLVDVLTTMGHRVTPALGGPAGVEAVRARVYDVVFSDLGMPEVNGWDLARAVKARDPRTAVVLVSGWGFQLEEDMAAARGVDRVMSKPFAFADVELTLREVHESRRRAA